MTLGGMRWNVKGEEAGILNDGEVNAQITDHLREYLASHFPAIAAAKLDRSWTGIMAGTKDGLPLIGEIPGRQGEYVCAAFNGYGMSFTFLAGALIAQMLESGKASHDAARLFSPRRFGV